MTSQTPRQKTFQEKLRKFKVVFNAMATKYTVRKDFIDDVRATFNKRSISPEAKVVRLKKILRAYPDAAAKTLSGKFGVHLPQGKTAKDSLKKYVAPMLRVL